MRCSFPLALLAGLLSTLPAPAGDEAEKKETWVGMSRAEIVKMLGEPDKLKQDGQGDELLVYKLVRVAPGGYPGPNLLLVEIPEVGLVGRALDRPDPPVRDAVIPSTDTDREGRPVDTPGTADRRHSSSFDSSTGEVETSWPEELPKGDAVLGKLTLKLRVGKDGRISEVVVPKKHRKRSGTGR